MPPGAGTAAAGDLDAPLVANVDILLVFASFLLLLHCKECVFWRVVRSALAAHMRDGDPDVEASALALRVLAGRGALGKATCAVAAAAAPQDSCAPCECPASACATLTWWGREALRLGARAKRRE